MTEFSRRRLTAASPLTAWEWLGLEGNYNLADGHAQGVPDVGFSHITDKLSEYFKDAVQQPYDRLETDFLQKFSALTGQTLRLHSTNLYYSSSLAIDVVAKVLAHLGQVKVGMLWPTFDNVPGLCTRAGLEVEPINELALIDNDDLDSQLKGLGALFLVVPNNPTGTEPERAVFERVASICAERGIYLILDLSFRLYSEMLTGWDQYQFLSSVPELTWMVVEDTGKSIPLAELKVGMLTVSENLAESVASITDELLLNVSPLALRTLSAAFAHELGPVNNLSRPNVRDLTCNRVVAGNREILRRALRDLPIKVTSPTSRISVELLELPAGVHAPNFVRRLSKVGVAVLPAAAFYWPNPEGYRSRVRLALFRSPTYFIAAVRAFSEHAALLLA